MSDAPLSGRLRASRQRVVPRSFADRLSPVRVCVRFVGRYAPAAYPQIRTEHLLSDSEVTYVKDRSVYHLSSLPFAIACLGLMAALLLPLGRTAMAVTPPPPQISGGDPDAPGSGSAPHNGGLPGGSGTLSVGQVLGDQTGRGGGIVIPLGKGTVIIRPRPATNITSWAGIKGLFR